jgi:hypothetical protein
MSGRGEKSYTIVDKEVELFFLKYIRGMFEKHCFLLIVSNRLVCSCLFIYNKTFMAIHSKHAKFSCPNPWSACVIAVSQYSSQW